jgi:hypothetical protein
VTLLHTILFQKINKAHDKDEEDNQCLQNKHLPTTEEIVRYKIYSFKPQDKNLCLALNGRNWLQLLKELFLDFFLDLKYCEILTKSSIVPNV